MCSDADKLKELLLSDAFRSFIAIIIGQRPSGRCGMVRRLRYCTFVSHGSAASEDRKFIILNVLAIGRPGQDYTCARHAESTEERWEANICIVGDHGTSDAEVWDSGEVGGYECYLPHSAEEGKGDVAVYNTNDTSVRYLYDRSLNFSKRDVSPRCASYLHLNNAG